MAVTEIVSYAVASYKNSAVTDLLYLSGYDVYAIMYSTSAIQPNGIFNIMQLTPSTLDI